MEPMMIEALTKLHSVLECPFADGEYYEEDFYLSVRCEALGGSCTYRSSGKDEYKTCKVLKNRSN